MKVIWRFFSPNGHEILNFEWCLSLEIQLNLFLKWFGKEKLVG